MSGACFGGSAIPARQHDAPMRTRNAAFHQFTNPAHRPAIASFFAVVPKARSANAAVDACGIPDGFSNAGAIISMSCLERSQEGSSKCRRNSTSAGS
jgi:hypothetical protein